MSGHVWFEEKQAFWRCRNCGGLIICNYVGCLPSPDHLVTADDVDLEPGDWGYPRLRLTCDQMVVYRIMHS